jgi:hypothetical protein
MLSLLAIAAAPSPFTPAHTEQLRCVAALAIVAHEQRRGADEWSELPDLAGRGAHFSEVVGQKIMADTKRPQEAVRDAILAEVAAFQKAYPGDAEIPEKTVTGCIALMDRIDPPAPPPSLLRCTALLGLAQDEMQRREGMTPVTSKLAVFAALIDGQARDQLLREGKTRNESDIAIGMERDAILADTAKRQAAGQNAEQDFEACFALANPPKEPHSKKEH